MPNLAKQVNNNNAKNPSIIVRVDVSIEVGLGHFVRSYALAYQLALLNYHIVFVIEEKAKSLVDDLSWFNFEYQVLNKDENGLEPLTRLINTLTDDLDIRAGILDGYHFSDDYRSRFKYLVNKLIVIDDNGESALFDSDIVINPSCFIDSSPNYLSLAPKAKHLLAYRLLRPEFLQVSELSAHKREGLVVIMGGSDPKALSGPVVKALSSLEVKITVVIGAGFSNKKALKKQLSDNQKPLLSYCENADASTLASLFSQARLVISAAGGTQFELESLKIPAILLVGYDNQWRNTCIAAQQTYCEMLDVRDNVDGKALVTLAEFMLKQDDNLIKQAFESRQVKTAKDAAKTIDEMIINS